MPDNNIQKRTALSIELLNELQSIHTSLTASAADIGKNSCNTFTQLFLESKTEIQSEIDRYKANINKIKNLNYVLTEMINSWFQFVKDTNQVSKLTYPIRFFTRKVKLSKAIKKANEDITEIIIENRFIKEQLTIWEHQLELKAVQQIKQGSGFETFEKLTKRKEELTYELKYLLSSIPGICPIQISLDELNPLISKLQSR